MGGLSCDSLIFKQVTNMATLKKTWVDSKGEEHGTEREADLQDLIYVSEAEVDAWLAQHADIKKTKEYARVLKQWEKDRIMREFAYKGTQAGPQEQSDARVIRTNDSLFMAALPDELNPVFEDDDPDFSGATLIKV
jgi:hypothetical protein